MITYVIIVCCNFTFRRRFKFIIGFGLTFAASAAPLLITELALSAPESRDGDVADCVDSRNASLLDSAYCLLCRRLYLS